MSAAGKGAERIVTPLVAVGLVLVSVISLIAYLALSAYAPDFRDQSNGDANAYSKSAIGFGGLRVLLDASDIPNTIYLGIPQHRKQGSGLFIVTPTISNGSGEIQHLAIPGPTLIILPKWWPISDPTSYERVLKMGSFEPKTIQKLLRLFSKDTKIARQSGTVAQYLFVTGKNRTPFLASPIRMDSLQTISGKDWVPILVNQKGGAVLAESRSQSVYVLADPDLMNTQGLHDLPTAAAALSIIAHLRAGAGPVSFDVTLNGFRRSPSLLRDAFVPPFLGATLCAILAAALIGFHAVSRFGTPQIAPPTFALGKRALANNTADLIRMMHREPHMAARYAQMTKALALCALGVRRQMDLRQTDAFLQSLERKDGTNYAELAAEADQVKTRSHLVVLANRFFQWRQEIIHAR